MSTLSKKKKSKGLGCNGIPVVCLMQSKCLDNIHYLLFQPPTETKRSMKKTLSQNRSSSLARRQPAITKTCAATCWGNHFVLSHSRQQRIWQQDEQQLDNSIKVFLWSNFGRTAKQDSSCWALRVIQSDTWAAQRHLFGCIILSYTHHSRLLGWRGISDGMAPVQVPEGDSRVKRRDSFSCFCQKSTNNSSFWLSLRNLINFRQSLRGCFPLAIFKNTPEHIHN